MRYPSINNHSFSSLRNALRLLNLFTIEEPELRLSDIASRLEIGESTAYRLTNTLQEGGMLVRDSHTKSFRLAATILAKGNVILSKIDLCHISRPILEKLANETGEASHIAVFKENQVMYLYQIDSLNHVHLLSHAGRLNPVHCTSTGQILLANQSNSIIQSIIEGGLKKYTPKTITEPNKLLQLLKKIQDQGYAVSTEELHEGVGSIAAPVKNKKGEVVASVSIAGPTSRMSPNTLPKLIKQVQKAANDITLTLKDSRKMK